MERRAEITVSSRLAATVPRGLGGFGIDSVEPGVKIGRSWVLAFGLIPVRLRRPHPGANRAGARLRPLIGAFFRHRHARLRRRFGGEPVALGG
jgi:hypothetical protein